MSIPARGLNPRFVLERTAISSYGHPARRYSLICSRIRRFSLPWSEKAPKSTGSPAPLVPVIFFSNRALLWAIRTPAALMILSVER